jgi:hypothetical protein
MAETCANSAARGRAFAIVSTEDLITRGIDVEVRDGSASGAVLARRDQARYSRGALRRWLCSGLKFDGLTDLSSSGIDTFAFFLDPR